MVHRRQLADKVRGYEHSKVLGNIKMDNIYRGGSLCIYFYQAFLLGGETRIL